MSDIYGECYIISRCWYDADEIRGKERSPKKMGNKSFWCQETEWFLYRLRVLLEIWCLTLELTNLTNNSNMLLYFQHQESWSYVVAQPLKIISVYCTLNTHQLRKSMEWGRMGQWGKILVLTFRNYSRTQHTGEWRPDYPVWALTVSLLEKQ